MTVSNGYSLTKDSRHSNPNLSLVIKNIFIGTRDDRR